MKIIKYFDDYRIDKILEYYSDDLSIKDGALPFYLSDNLKAILKEIIHPIAYKLLKTSKEEEYKKETMLDVIYDEKDKLSFITSNKIIDIIHNDINKINNYNNYTIKSYINFYENELKKYKIKIKIGKLINKLFPNEFKPNGYPDNDIQSFMDMYATVLTKDYDLFEIVQGDDIVHYYNKNQIAYFDINTPLTNSCMNKAMCSGFLKFYAINSPTVRLIILHNEKDKSKIDGRALIWKLSEINDKQVKNKYFVDRIYYNSNNHLIKFLSYIKSNGYLHKSRQNSDEDCPIYGYEKDKSVEIKMVVKGIKCPKPDELQFPFLDTLYNYNPYDGILTNNNNHIQSNKYTPLWDTYGQSNIRYSKRYNQVFVTTDKEWIIDFINNEWIKKIDAVHISINHRYTHKDNIDKYFVKSKYHDSWIQKNESEYIEKYKDWVLKVRLHPYHGWVYNNFSDEWLKIEDSIYSDRLFTYVDIKNHIKIYKDYSKQKFIVSYEDDPTDDYYKYKGDYYFNDVKKEDIDKYNEINKNT